MSRVYTFYSLRIDFCRILVTKGFNLCDLLYAYFHDGALWNEGFSIAQKEV